MPNAFPTNQQMVREQAAKLIFRNIQTPGTVQALALRQQREISSYFQAPLVTRKENQYVTAS